MIVRYEGLAQTSLLWQQDENRGFRPLTSSRGLDMVNLENPDGLRFIKLGCKQHWCGVIQR